MEEKKRVPNFLIQEKKLLTNLVFAHKHIIENNKNKHSQTWREKNMAWEKITTQFNARSPQELPRSTKSLRKLYDNMKKQLRKEIAGEKTELNKTGGVFKSKTDLDDQSKIELLKLFFENPSIEIVKDRVEDNIFKPSGYNYSTAETEAETDQPSTSKENIKVFVETSKLFTPKGCDKEAASSSKRPSSTEVLHHNCTKKRPKIQQPASNMIEEYSSLAKVKLDFYQAEKENLIIKRRHDEMLFNLEKNKIELEIKIKEFQLDKLKQNT